MAKQAKARLSASQAVDEAVSWETERLVATRRSERTAWIVAALAGVMALAAVIALAGLTPLKEVSPFVIRVDKATGIVDVVSGMKQAPNTYANAVTRYFAARYVDARESYSKALAPTNYNRVGLMSDGRVAKIYFGEFSPQNPQSPLRVHGDSGLVAAEIISISFLDADLLSVRFTKTVTRDNRPPVTTHWIATIKYRYSKAPMKESDRLVNPLGFQVTEYRVTPETVGRTEG